MTRDEASAGASPDAIQAGAGEGLWPLPDWLKAVENDPTYAWVVSQWKRAASVPGAWFDYAKAQGAVDLWPTIFTLTEDRFAGKPFRLVLWQEFIVRLLVGWKVPVDLLDEETGEPKVEQVRLFRRLMLWIPRKNGKSEFLSALALLFFVLDGTVAGQGFAFARDEKQAKIVFDKMKAMVFGERSDGKPPPLAKGIVGFKKSLWIPKIRALFELLTGKAEGKHGRSPTVIVGDEMHEWESLDLSTTLRQGTGARLQPIELYASTAGLKDKVVGFGLWEESRAILEGRIDDPTTLVVIFAADPDADPFDEANWPGANPSLGLSPTMAFLRREAALAKDNPRAEAHFRRYHLNQWVDSLVRWLNIKRWDACAKDKKAWKRFPKDLLGRKCFLTIDVSSTQDVTALVLLFPPVEPGEPWKLVCRFWVPEETLANRVRNDRVSYDKWLSVGALETTDGDYVDQNAVYEAVLEAFNDYEIELLGYDPWNARKLIGDLQKAGVDPEKMVEIRQGIPSLGEGTKHFERLVYAGQMDHGGNPMLRWMAGNTVVRFDENMNFAPAKKKSREKIDGIVAAVMGCVLAFHEEPEDETIGGGVVEV
ncbi:terminase large subunit [Caulobacter vibrioides]|uniref:terminase large subunit n=1 Tax=Caulobacter vibrioides TaxID=155892 RepID=UPI000BB4C3F6|nr:terminase TerL endonuclease subunit [Caulobacter vibrioides]ATC26488.1 terminase large subunit [Caulobacter vibrioides]PLR12310.1 terminase large subunit [Caulobacter vibrioides]